ncbi:FAH family protein [Streptomyces sp. A3M-1-3]|uniref:FAH family protein n=1 Tax=Streptomyces sp. A3M-1-3 TaxID=2962044 RepID=UPI0020B8AACB|nr:FAH family protein [Streptomyces sp. A3M-1-3]MCP3820219.1 FAH family protein [Streptomyces sp. A3M-1-3]
MTMLFECTHRGERYFGFDRPEDGAPLHLYPLKDDDLHAAVLAADGDSAALVAALTDGKDAVAVPAEELGALRMRPPLLPTAVGDAMVGGFMQTHNVKVDATTQAQPNWFLKGLGDVLKVSGEELAVPESAVTVTEEAEVVLVYVTDEEGEARYVGHTFGNDLTDIGRFRQHHGHLSYAKLCDASVAPWLFLGPPPVSVTGRVTIERDGREAWRAPFATGTRAMHYRLEDIMPALFGHRALLHPGRVHYVYIGADRSSFHGGFQIADGDRVTLEFAEHGVTVSNTVSWPRPAATNPAGR